MISSSFISGIFSGFFSICVSLARSFDNSSSSSTLFSFFISSKFFSNSYFLIIYSGISFRELIVKSLTPLSTKNCSSMPSLGAKNFDFKESFFIIFSSSIK
ncbi:hypothetical protein [Aliarcobacter butzleri]|uniref:hypothetical protein n=1 Tax=Aliarcobacter butzleri TaxID=28197 RepID=UPI001D00D66F|nr:hypothetical protein [Aliarcobacter butzleri]